MNDFKETLSNFEATLNDFEALVNLELSISGHNVVLVFDVEVVHHVVFILENRDAVFGPSY